MKHIKKFEMKEVKLKDYSERPSERETVALGRDRLRKLLYKGIVGETEYTPIENKITSSDPEDGGADHVCVFKRNSDEKYFKFEYTDWDIDYNFERDFPTSATEVFPKIITKTIFE